MGFFYACVNEEVPVTELEFTKRASGANSTEAFRNTVHPILLKRCASCHGDNGSNLRHSVSDYKQSHGVIVDGGKVDFSNPSNSRLVEKLIGQRHNCWNNDCTTSGAEMLAGIKEWIELRGEAPETLDGATTVSLKYGNAVKTTPETIAGSILLQAEDGILSGRMKTHVHSQASGFSYIAGDNPPVHPIEQTGRTPDVSGNCRNVSSADLANTTTGRYKLTERRRHINQEGYRYYSQRIRFRIIRPSKRAEYQAEIKAGRTDIANLQKFFLATGAEDAANGFVLQGTAQLDRGDTLRTLPEFLEHGQYLTQINSQSVTYKDFFAPRFGVSGIDYFTPTNEEIRANLPSYLKNTIVFTKLESSFLEYFYDDIYGARTPENSIYAAPYTMRSMPDGGGGTIPFQVNNQTLADNFYNHYWNGLTAGNSLNPVSGGDPTHLIDTYIHYYVDPDDRDFEDFRWKYGANDELFDLNRGNTNLDLSAILADSALVDDRAIMTANYGETLWPVVKANCASCHGDGSGRPQFAHPNESISFDAMIGYANFSVPSNSRPATRMDEGHNCGANCASIKSEMVAAISSWATKNTADIEAAKNASAPELKSLSVKDRSPARARYTINITEAGAYNVWFKVLTTDTKRRFDLRILDDQNRPVPNCTATSSCNTSGTTYNGKTTAQIDDMFCREYNTGTHNEWSWYTPSINDLEDRIKWNLAKGTYSLEIIEEDVNAKIDIIAISKNPEFNPAKNLIDEGLISSAEPRILRYDVSKLINSPGVFEIEIIERNGGDAYIFRNPRFVGNTEKIKVKNIKVLVNDKYEFTDSSYTKIDATVGTEKTNLTYAPLVALAINGLGSDSFKFVFEDLKTTSSGLTSTEDDAPVAVEGRKCQNLALFEATVMPILNRFRLVRKDGDGYTDYSSDDGQYPGNNRQAGANAQFYTCTTCHTENHPYFKMTTFFNNSEVLCEQALSRVDFGNFERSLLLRGLNGTFNHPKLHFVESVDLTGSGNSRRFKTNASKVNGFDSSWAGRRFEKYTNGTGSGQINLGAYSGAERAYLDKFIGQYVKMKYVRINDPFAAEDGEIRLPGDSYDSGSIEQDKWTYATTGRNMMVPMNPEDFVADQGDLNPNSVTAGGLIKVKDSCVNVNFNENNGVVTDPCNSNVDVITEFELIKTRYRESIINWMNEEKKSAN
jgi:mono/diheme cytochrome c family protein